MNSISIDIETFSDRNIKDCGVYKYTESPVFDILLLSYSIDKAPVVTIDLTIEVLPQFIIDAILNPEVAKFAYNASFERRCLSVYLKQDLPPEQWYCTMVKSAMIGLPFGLDAVAKALKIDQGKLAEGKALVKYFCGPCKPTKVNGQRVRNMPWHDPDKWQKFIEYNKRDVELERIIADKIEFFTPTETERKLWALDQRMNDRGVLLDIDFINKAIELDENNKVKLIEEAKRITGLENPNSNTQLKGWLCEKTSLDIGSLAKNNVVALLNEYAHKSEVERVLLIRQELNKTSNKKYPAMIDCACSDQRARGTIQYYGAGRTGRYSGRLFQPQNLPKSVVNKDSDAANDVDLDIARNLILQGDTDSIETMFGNVPDTLSACIRTALIAAPGKRFIAVDLSAIEARVIAWLANEKWRLDVFATHGKIYEASGAAMFKVPIESITKGSKLRDKAKIAELTLGFQGGTAALIRMGALEMGLTEDELQPLVYDWRNANKKIVEYWYNINAAALQAVKDRVKVTTNKGITFHVERGILWVTLCSGRALAYLRPQVGLNKYGNESVSYEGMDQDTKQWKRIDTYGGKLVENIVQGTARDVLAHKMLDTDAAGYELILSVHDELVIEYRALDGYYVGPDEEPTTLQHCIDIMKAPVSWAPGLPLNADGFESKYYKK